MMQMNLNRRELLKTSGALTVWFSLPDAIKAQESHSYRGPSPAQLDSFIRIDSQNQVEIFFGKMDMGQGVNIAIAQMVADELDASMENINVIMGDTLLTVNQGGGSGSTGIELGSKPIVQAAAEARRFIVNHAARRFGLLPQQILLRDGMAVSTLDVNQSLSYGELLSDGYFDIKLNWNGVYGNGLDVSSLALPKTSDQYSVVGSSFQRPEITNIVYGNFKFITEVKIPGMWHARMVRPPHAGAEIIEIDIDSISDIPNTELIRQGNFLAVIAPKEWHAIKALNTLQVNWTEPQDLFPEQDELYEYIQNASVARRSSGGAREPDVEPDESEFNNAIQYATNVITASYEFPYQSHASMGPACAVCDVRDDNIILYTATQKPHYAAQGVARLLGYDEDQVRAIWVAGPGSYGRNDSGDCALDAALISKLSGRPIRLQGMRHDGTQWDPKAPASVHQATAGFNLNGEVIAFKFLSKGFSAGDIESNESNPQHSYAGMQTGLAIDHTPRFLNPSDRYNFPNEVRYWETILPLLDRASPLRTSHLRDPLGPQIHFASECFIDEMAFAVSQDPIAFRLRYLNEERDRGVLISASERYAWQPRVAASLIQQNSNLVSGRGVAYTRRNNTVVAVICEVDINLTSGRIYPRKFVIASDQGLIINPLWLRRTIEGNILHGISRSLLEEVSFSSQHVTSNDWLSYRTVNIDLCPEEIEIILLNNVDLPPYGAGEPSIRAVTPAIANAVFDAIGIRLRRAPFTPERVLEALAQA